MQTAILSGLVFTFALIVARPAARCGQPVGTQELVALARQYLAADDAAAKARLAQQLDATPCDPDAIVRALRPVAPREFKTGYLQAEHFQTPELRDRHPGDLLYIVVPQSYRPEHSTGLIVMMHGGGGGSPRQAPGAYMTAEAKPQALGREFAASGMIAVGPSAPWNEKSHSRWCLPETDDYIRDVVLEMQSRFSIDPDRVVLMGHSMGGFGAYHQAQRQPDRFCLVLASAGSWQLAYWPVLHGTPLSIIHGARDAEPGVRPHFTDVAYARLADKLLTEQGVAHEYREHRGGHAIDDGRPVYGELVERMPSLRRDAYGAHVVAVTPRGWSADARYEAPHNRWLTILETGPGTLTYDALTAQGPPQSHKMPLENWEGWRLIPGRRELPAALVEGFSRGGNRFEVTTRNVRRFALWLHPKMVDFSRPVSVRVDGKDAFQGLVRPTLSTALQSFERRRDWGLVYTAELRFDVSR